MVEFGWSFFFQKEDHEIQPLTHKLRLMMICFSSVYSFRFVLNYVLAVGCESLYTYIIKTGEISLVHFVVFKSDSFQ